MDLSKAKEALAGDRVDEASVHAWNALAVIGPEGGEELARVARELGDRALLRELERRGFPTEAAEAAEPPEPPVGRKPVLRLLRAVLGLLVVLIVIGVILASIPLESGPRYPSPEVAAPEARFPGPILARSSGVSLVPLGEPSSVDLARLADEISVRYRIPVAVLPDIGLPSWTLDADDGRLVGEQLLALLAHAYRADGAAVVIGITDYDMYGRREELAHAFSLRSRPHYAVVSTSPLGPSLFDRVCGHSRHERTRKLVARNISFLYYGRDEVDDPRSLLRPQMDGVDDIDALEEAL